MSKAPVYIRKIKCPWHFLIPPTVDVYLREPVPELKSVSKSVISRFKLRRERIKYDMFGNKMVDWKKLYALEKAGIVKQPEVSAKFAVEHIYDPKGLLCKMCDKRCLNEGMEGVRTQTIKRLNGSYYKGPDVKEGGIELVG